MPSLPPRTSTALLGLAALGGVLAAACSETTSPTTSTATTSALLSTAFSSASPGYNYVASSFNASGNTGTFGPGGGHGDHGGGPGFGDFMGGGLGGDFAGLGGFGPGFGRGLFGTPFGGAPLGTCTFDAGTGRITCAPVTVNGLTISSYAIYKNATGQAQQAFDTTTNTATTHVEVSGTTTFTPHDRRGFGPGFGPDSSQVTVASATSTVKDVSDRTVTGLVSGSTQRTVNGTSSGSESTTGKLSDSTTFTAARTMGDTTTNLVIPVQTGSSVYPTGGSVIRAMQATVTLQNGTTKSTSRREVITYDGSATAKVTITQNDTTRTCTLPLPRGRLSCS